MRADRGIQPVTGNRDWCFRGVTIKREGKQAANRSEYHVRGIPYSTKSLEK